MALFDSYGRGDRKRDESEGELHIAKGPAERTKPLYMGRLLYQLS